MMMKRKVTILTVEEKGEGAILTEKRKKGGYNTN
jgi:hypothetical protein